MSDCILHDSGQAQESQVFRQNRQKMASRMAERAGAVLVPIQAGPGPTLMVTALGSGSLMALCDRLAETNPGVPIWAADLPGSMGFDQRVVALDYLMTAFHCVAWLWCSMTPAFEYAAALRGRAFRPLFQVFACVRGTGVIPFEWERLGITLTDDPFSVKITPEGLAGGVSVDATTLTRGGSPATT